MHTKQKLGIIASIPIFFLSITMFAHVMGGTTPWRIPWDMVFVNMTVVGGYVILLKTSKKKTATIKVELDAL